MAILHSYHEQLPEGYDYRVPGQPRIGGVFATVTVLGKCTDHLPLEPAGVLEDTWNLPVTKLFLEVAARVVCFNWARPSLQVFFFFSKRVRVFHIPLVLRLEPIVSATAVPSTPRRAELSDGNE